MTTIFRHLRPLKFDRQRGQAVPAAGLGGVSFALRPTGPATYDFWVTYVPEGNTLTARAATVALRRAIDRGVVPRGQLRLDSRPLLEQLADHVLNERELPSEVASLIIKVLVNNDRVMATAREWREQVTATAKETYSESD
jgi:hypothetical protein